MRIESITAHAFGSFVGETLDLAQGMTVIHGPNESGKSTWHAALYVGLCGMRRGPGQRGEDREFTDRHRPWAGDDWEVSEIIELEDGRRIELHHDLDGKVDCQARDADLGRDYSNEIIHEGAPDGARWLGLDRKSFLSTACVRQADIQLVMEQAPALQDELQRAAATAGTDSTAAAALSRLEGFQKENVGLDRANSTRPLRTAKNRRERAQLRLEDARGVHSDYLRQQEEVEQLQDKLAHAERSLKLVEADRAATRAAQWEKNVGRARELAARYPEEPPAQAESREAAEAISIALGRWNERPDAIELQGPTAEELRSELIQLPSMPEGDTSPHVDVVNAKNQLSVARSTLERHQREEPPEPPVVDARDLAATQLRDLSAELALQDPAIDPQAQERATRAREKAEELGQPTVRAQSSQEPKRIPLPLRPVAFLVRMIQAAVRALLTMVRGGVDQAARIRAMEELRDAQEQLGDVRFRLEDTRRRRNAAKDKAIQHGLPAKAAEILQLAAQIEHADQSRREMERWETQEESLRQEFDEAEDLLLEALKGRGVAEVSSPSAAFGRYEEECSARERVAREASQKPDLKRAYEARQREEAVAQDAERRRREAGERLCVAAKAIGVTGDTDDETVDQLRTWLVTYNQSASESELARKEWDELQALLNSGTLQDFEEAATQQRDQADQLASGLEPAEMGGVALEDDVEAQLNRLRDDCSNARSDLANKKGRLEEYARKMASVPEAEEELARADAELTRIIALDQTLTRTQEFLKHAQDKVHRTLAPLLRDAIKPWLRAVTGGRYTELRIDVESLMVHVSGDGRNWRPAPRLSHGTAEQVYLLLRVAMARQLTRQGEICPLILDDVTVNCDPVRQTEILNLLHAITQEQQVILFSQESETLHWAQQQLSESRDRLVELPQPGVPA